MSATMVRISAAIRDETINNLLAKKYLEDDAKLDKLAEEKKAAAKAMRQLAYEACFSKKQIEQMESLPNGWLPVAKSARIRIENPNNPSDYTDEIASWVDDGIAEPSLRKVPYKNSTYGGSSYAAVITFDHPYVAAKKEYEAKEREYDAFYVDLRDRKRATRAKITRIIESVTTVKRLLEIWPQVQEFLPEMVSGEGGGVPAQLIEDLNTDLGIAA